MTVFASPKYLITSRKKSLERIENSIQCAEFYKNRSFIFSRLASVNPDFDAILPEFKENIRTDWSEDIPVLFKEQKKEVFNAMFKIEEIHERLREFVESVDPIEACCIAQSLAREEGIIRLPEIFSMDFYYDAKNFREMVENLRDDGALENYVSTRECIVNEANDLLQDYPADQIINNTVHEIMIEYNPVDLKFMRLTSKLSNKQENNLFEQDSQIIEAREGRIVLLWKIGIYFINDKNISMHDYPIHEIMEKMYTLKYYEDEEIVNGRS